MKTPLFEAIYIPEYVIFSQSFRAIIVLVRLTSSKTYDLVSYIKKRKR